ncbi:MAG TPA: AAA family ATPase [Chloroflexia bacterium]|nr:AAA family ATPase [Chloroflexia bacterium]
MYIQEIHINSFRHLENVHLGPFAEPPASSDLIVLAGPNGGGKSSVLELLGYAVSNSFNLSWALRRTFPESSFEVAIGLSQDEINLLRQYLAHFQPQDIDLHKFIEQNSTYYRAFNYYEGEFEKNPNLYIRIHQTVTSVVGTAANRPLGFFLKPDRDYPAIRFAQNQLFDYEQKIQPSYIASLAFVTSEAQYRDIFDYLVQQGYQYTFDLGNHYKRMLTGNTAGNSPPDPLRPYDDLLQKLFPGYRFVESDERIPSNLFVKTPSGVQIPFSDLSSGEKEVFFISSFFLRQNVTNAIIMIDEPELHLHPELARLLVSTMQSIKLGNQIWLATHNPEIIDEAGIDHTIYLARDSETHKPIATRGTDEAAAARLLKELFGYSGYIGIAKNIVFLEGTDSSVDRKMFSRLFPEYKSKLKFVPCGSFENLPRINAAILNILSSNLGWTEFHLIRDRDYLTADAIQQQIAPFAGRMHILERHHIENYLLDDDLIARVQTDIFERLTTSAEVARKLKRLAVRLTGEVLRDMIAYRLNLIYQPEDFSLGKFLEDQPVLDSAGTWVDSRLTDLTQHLAKKVGETNERLFAQTDSAALQALLSACQDEVRQAVMGNSDGWRSLFPARRLLQEYAQSESLGKNGYIVLQNNLIRELSATPEKVAAELRQIIEAIVNGSLTAAQS